jgi:hypothetical protein
MLDSSPPAEELLPKPLIIMRGSLTIWLKMTGAKW